MQIYSFVNVLDLLVTWSIVIKKYLKGNLGILLAVMYNRYKLLEVFQNKVVEELKDVNSLIKESKYYFAPNI